MYRFLLAAILVLAATCAVATDLPTGKWLVNVNSTKGELVVSEISKDGKVQAKLLGVDVTGTWKNGVLTLNEAPTTVLVGRLVTEEVKGRTKYTLTGFRKEINFFRVGEETEVTTGWYATVFLPTPPPQGEIKVEVKGILVCPQDKPLADAHISVKQKNSFGDIEETRIYFYLSEGEWKGRRDDYLRLNGESVTVTGTITQMPKGTSTSIPENALYFQRGYELKTAKETPK
jgi:hypothetical protein